MTLTEDGRICVGVITEDGRIVFDGIVEDGRITLFGIREIFESEVGSGVDATQSIHAAIESGEEGVGLEELGSREFDAAETGMGVDEILSHIAATSKSDDGAGIEAEILKKIDKVVFGSDTGNGVDTLNKLEAAIESGEEGVGLEELGSREFGAAETGMGVDEILSHIAAISGTDQGLGLETIEELRGSLFSSDGGSGIESETVIESIFLLLELLQTTALQTQMDWLAGYTNRKKGGVNATIAGAQTDYELKLIVGESSGSSGVDVHCNGHCESFPNDIRFTKEDCETKHDYWVDISSLEGTTPNRKATVWIEVASIPASGSVDFYMYYGKSPDSGESNGENTFEFFDDFDFGQNSFVKHGSNPLLGLGSPGEFDDEGVYDPSILKVSNTFYLYYSAYLGTQVITEGLATSPDGITWTRQGKVLDGGTTGDWDDLKAHDVAVIEEGGSWYMWYSGTRNPETTYGLKIGLAISPDGINWTKNSGCANCSGCAGNGCVMDKGTAGKFDDQHVVYPAVIKEDGTYYMWYSGAKSGSGYSGIGLATSTDGINWTRQNSGNAVFEKSADAWESEYVYQADVKKIGDRYWMVYTGVNGSDVRRLGLAYSADKINWTRYASNPISELGGSGEWDEVKHITGAFSTVNYPEVRIYYTGHDTSANTRIGLVTIPNIEALLGNDWTEEVNGASASILLSDSKVQLQATDAGHYANLYSKQITNAPCALQVQGLDIDGIGNLAIKLTKDGAWPIQTDCALFGIYDQAIGGGGNSDILGRMFWGSGPSSEITWRDYDVGDTYNKDDLDIIIRNDRKGEWKIEGASKGVSTAALDDESWRVQLVAIGERGAADIYIDRLFLRNYASPEPTWGSWGEDEQEQNLKNLMLKLKLLQEKVLNVKLSQEMSEV